jgi:hypothetical protein
LTNVSEVLTVSIIRAMRPHQSTSVSIITNKNWKKICNKLGINRQKIFENRFHDIYGHILPMKDENTLIKDEFYGKLNKIIVKVGGMRELIIMTDLNGRVGRRNYDLVVGNFGEGIIIDMEWIL